MAVPVVDSAAYIEKLRTAYRPGGEQILAFYEHRLGVICRDPQLMLMLWDDHLAHRGDGVFEALKWEERKLYQVEAHLRRMERSSGAIHLAPPCGWKELAEIAVEVARAAATDQGLLRLLLGRGPGGFGISPTECPVPSLYVVAYVFQPLSEETYRLGSTAFRTSIPAKQSWMAGIKCVDYLPNAMMKLEAVTQGFDYPVCFDEQGFLAESATENVCLVDRDGTLVAPELSNALAGTTLRRGLDLMAREMPVAFRKVREPDILEAREVMVLGTLYDAVSIVRYNGKPIHDVRPGPVAQRMRALLRQDLRDNGRSL